MAKKAVKDEIEVLGDAMSRKLSRWSNLVGFKLDEGQRKVRLLRKVASIRLRDWRHIKNAVANVIRNKGWEVAFA